MADIVMDEDFEDGLEEEEDLSVASFQKDVEEVAKFYIDTFFAKKEMYGGGPIPRCNLHSPDYIDWVLNTDVCSGVDRAYSILETDELPDENEEKNPADVQMVLDIFHECESLLVPKEFAPGIMLMCLEICHGFRQIKEAN